MWGLLRSPNYRQPNSLGRCLHSQQVSPPLLVSLPRPSRSGQSQEHQGQLLCPSPSLEGGEGREGGRGGREGREGWREGGREGGRRGREGGREGGKGYVRMCTFPCNYALAPPFLLPPSMHVCTYMYIIHNNKKPEE